jgi:hypothetical protein
MTTVKWKRDEQAETDTKPELAEDELHRDASVSDGLIQIADDIAKAIHDDAKMVAVYRDPAREGYAQVVVCLITTGAVYVVEIPEAADSIDQADEHAVEYASGYALMKELIERLPKKDTGVPILAKAMHDFDRAYSASLAGKWGYLLPDVLGTEKALEEAINPLLKAIQELSGLADKKPK